MKVTVETLSDLIVTLEVTPEMELENFKALCECEIGFTADRMVITHEERPLLDNKKYLKDYGIQQGDMLVIQQMMLHPTSNQFSDFEIDIDAFRVSPHYKRNSSISAIIPSKSTSFINVDKVERLRQKLTDSPDNLNLLKQNNPRLAHAYLTGNPELLAQELNWQLAEKSERERWRTHLLNSNPYDSEAQHSIAEEIRQDNVDSNLEAAIEHYPESFGKVPLLFIDCKVNGHSVRAFIDTGAEITTMSRTCAHQCDIIRLVDERWTGIVTGVGVQKIIGRVHLCHVQINDVFLQCSILVLEKLAADMVIGLDILKPHQCCIDLKRNVLVIGTTDTETPF